VTGKSANSGNVVKSNTNGGLELNLARIFSVEEREIWGIYPATCQ
jgi:hypothetical protein